MAVSKRCSSLPRATCLVDFGSVSNDRAVAGVPVPGVCVSVGLDRRWVNVSSGPRIS